LNKIKLEVGIFLFLTFFTSSIFTYLWVTTEDSGWLLGFAWGPGIAGLLTAFLFRRNLKGFGWKLGEIKYQVMSYLTPILYSLLVYGLVWLSPLGSYGGLDSAYVTSVAFFAMFILFAEGTLYAAHSAVGEEIGWRGYLTPKLLQNYSPFQISLIIGVIWSIWHYPIIVLGLYGTEINMFYQLACFSLMTIGVNFIYTWFRIKSGSLWTGLLLHSSHNLYIQHVFDPLTLNTGKTEYIIGEFGASFALFGIIIIFVVFFNKEHFNNSLSKST
jgi:membrane protease YdiL (CAAX protease family)